MKKKNLKIVNWKHLLVVELVVCYMALLALVSHAKGPAKLRELDEPMIEAEAFVDEHGAWAEDGVFRFANTTGSASVYAAWVTLTDVHGIAVRYTVDCPADFAGSHLYTDLYNLEENYDNAEQEYVLTLQEGANEAAFTLDPSENAPEKAMLRFFTPDPAGYDARDIRIRRTEEMPKLGEGLLIGVGVCFAALLATLAVGYAQSRKRVETVTPDGWEKRNRLLPSEAPADRRAVVEDVPIDAGLGATEVEAEFVDVEMAAAGSACAPDGAEEDGSSIGRKEAENLYRYILGREPESEEVVSGMVESGSDLETLRLGFLGSEEHLSELQRVFHLVPVVYGTYDSSKIASYEDVVNAYRYILGRDPESEERIVMTLGAEQNLSDLRKNMLLSQELEMDIRRLRMVDGGGIKRLTLVATSACNCDCAHCAQLHQRTANEMDCAALSAKLMESMHFNGGHLSVTGGEPFLKSGFPGMLAKLSNLGRWGIDVTTNGTCVEAVREFSEWGNPETVSFFVSVDGPPEIHNRIRRNPKAYSCALESIRILKEKGFAVSVNTVLQKDNMAYLDLFERLIAKECGSIPINWIPEIAESAGSKEFPYSEREMQLFAARVKQQNDPARIVYLRTRGAALLKNCHAGMRTMTVMPDGAVYTCYTGAVYKAYQQPEKLKRYRLGNLREESLDEIWEREQRSRSRWRSAAAECEGCWNYCELVNESDFAGVDPYEQYR